MRPPTGMEDLAEQLTDPSRVATLSAASLAGTLSASMIARVCEGALDTGASGKAEEGIREIRDKAIRLRRDLVTLIDHSAVVDRLMAQPRSSRDPERLKDLLFSSEIPYRIAVSCHTLMALSLKLLGRVGLKGIAEIGTASGLAFAAIVGSATVARTALSEIDKEGQSFPSLTREKAERILREADATRAHITERVLKHLP